MSGENYAVFRNGCEHCGSSDLERLSVWLSREAVDNYLKSAKSTYKESKLFILKRDEDS